MCLCMRSARLCVGRGVGREDAGGICRLVIIMMNAFTPATLAIHATTYHMLPAAAWSSSLSLPSLVLAFAHVVLVQSVVQPKKKKSCAAASTGETLCCLCPCCMPHSCRHNLRRGAPTRQARAYDEWHAHARRVAPTSTGAKRTTGLARQRSKANIIEQLHL